MREHDLAFFADRNDAGRRLAARLLAYKGTHPVVLALPRGGVPVGYEVATQLHAPLDIVLVRKIGAPLQPELALGAIVEGNPVQRFINRAIVTELGVPQSYIEEEISREAREIERRRSAYLRGRAPVAVAGHVAIIVDDGIATGATMRAALRAIRSRDPSQLVLAIPVAPASALEELRAEVDDIVCVLAPDDLGAIGFFYRDFHQLDDKDVIALLTAAANRQTDSARKPD